MAWNLWSIKSESTYEFWGCGVFSSNTDQNYVWVFLMIFKNPLFIACVSVDKNMDEILVGAVVFKEKIHFSDVKDYKEYVNFGAL